jgi:hypothetical protein
MVRVQVQPRLALAELTHEKLVRTKTLVRGDERSSDSATLVAMAMIPANVLEWIIVSPPLAGGRS